MAASQLNMFFSLKLNFQFKNFFLSSKNGNYDSHACRPSQGAMNDDVEVEMTLT